MSGGGSVGGGQDRWRQCLHQQGEGPRAAELGRAPWKGSQLLQRGSLLFKGPTQLLVSAWGPLGYHVTSLLASSDYGFITHVILMKLIFPTDFFLFFYFFFGHTAWLAGF